MRLHASRWLAGGLAVLLAVALVPMAQSKSLDGMREGALAWVEARSLEGAGALAPAFAEAVAANGLDAAAWPAQRPLADQVTIPGPEAAAIQLLRPLRALALAGDPRGALDGALAQRVLSSFDGTQFGAPSALNDDAYAILALTAAGLPASDGRIDASAHALARAQNADGGWGWATGTASGTDMTGLILTALDAADRLPDPAYDRAMAFLATTKQAAGHSETPGASANCESTAWALRAQGLRAAADAAHWRFLQGLQQPDGGFAHLPGGPSDPLCTAEVLTVTGLAQAGALPLLLEEGRGSPAPGLAWTVVALSASAMAMSTRFRHS